MSDMNVGTPDMALTVALNRARFMTVCGHRSCTLRHETIVD